MTFILRIKMFFVLMLAFALFYAIASIVSVIFGFYSIAFAVSFACFLLFIQYLIGPKIVELSMGVRYISKEEYPELHEIVEELARKAKIRKPKVGICNLSIPNAFAFGRGVGDGRVCVTRGIVELLDREELKAVLGHEISHLKNRDVIIITMLSAIPLICWMIARNSIYVAAFEERPAQAIIIGLAAFIFYLITNLVVLYASRIREYYADLGSVKLGNKPSALASALYKIVYGSARSDESELRRVEGLKAFFLNDVSRAYNEITELKQIDMDMSGKIEEDELAALRSKKIRVGFAERIMELLSTHPNTLKRIKFLASLG